MRRRQRNAQPKKTYLSAPCVCAVRADRQVLVELPTLRSAEVALNTLIENLRDLSAMHIKVRDRQRGRALADHVDCHAHPQRSESNSMYISRNRSSESTGCSSKHTALFSLAARGYAVPRCRSYRRTAG